MKFVRWKMSAEWSFTFQHFKFPLLPLLTHSAMYMYTTERGGVLGCTFPTSLTSKRLSVAQEISRGPKEILRSKGMYNPFSHHHHRDVLIETLSTVNAHCPVGMDSLIHPLGWIYDERMAVNSLQISLGLWNFPGALPSGNILVVRDVYCITQYYYHV